MALTKEQIEARRDWIGGSDIPIIMGLSEYSSPRELWMEKTRRVETGGSGGVAASLGDRLEPVILDFAEEELGPLKRNVHFEADGLDFPLRVQCDAIQETNAGQIPVEAKSMGIYNPFLPALSEYGDEFTDEIPDMHAVQLTAQIMATDAEVGHLFAFLSGRGICAFKIGRSPIVVESIKKACAEFWECVVSDTPPRDDTPLSLEVVKRTKRIPEKIVTLSEACYLNVSSLDQWKESRKEADKNIKGLQAEILAELGDAEAGMLPDGRMITYLESDRKGYTVEPSTVRTMRIKGKPKGAKA